MPLALRHRPPSIPARHGRGQEGRSRRGGAMKRLWGTTTVVALVRGGSSPRSARASRPGRPGPRVREHWEAPPGQAARGNHLGHRIGRVVKAEVHVGHVADRTAGGAQQQERGRLLFCRAPSGPRAPAMAVRASGGRHSLSLRSPSSRGSPRNSSRVASRSRCAVSARRTPSRLPPALLSLALVFACLRLRGHGRIRLGWSRPSARAARELRLLRAGPDHVVALAVASGLRSVKP
jgi:hypothetical protein